MSKSAEPTPEDEYPMEMPLEDELTCCGVAMVPYTGVDYVCQECGLVEAVKYEWIDEEDLKKKHMKPVAYGGSARKYRKLMNDVKVDYADTQRKALLAKFMYCFNNSSVKTVPKDIAMEVVKICQVSLTEHTNRNGILDQIFAAVIKYVCTARDVTVNDADITQFMRLKSSGFSVGEKIVRNLANDGKIKLDIQKEPTEGQVQRAFHELKLDRKYINFVNSMLSAIKTHRIVRTSKTQTKIMACIWLLINSLNMRTTATEVGKCGVCPQTFVGTAREIYRKIRKKSRKTEFKKLFSDYRLSMVSP